MGVAANFFRKQRLYPLRLSRIRPIEGPKPEIENDPPDDSFGLLGVRTNFWPIPFFVCNVCIALLHSDFESYSVNIQRAEVWGARDMSVP